MNDSIPTSGTAALVKPLTGWSGDAALYRVDPPLDGNEHVVVSAVRESIGAYPICETYIFAADASGNVSSYMELPGSFKGDTNHAEALGGAGYEVKA